MQFYSFFVIFFVLFNIKVMKFVIIDRFVQGMHLNLLALKCY